MLFERGHAVGIECLPNRVAAPLALNGGDEMGVVADRPEVALRSVAEIDDGRVGGDGVGHYALEPVAGSESEARGLSDGGVGRLRVCGSRGLTGMLARRRAGGSRAARGKSASDTSFIRCRFIVGTVRCTHSEAQVSN